MTDFNKAKSEALDILLYRLREVWEYDIPIEVEGDLISWEWHVETEMGKLIDENKDLKSELEALEQEHEDHIRRGKEASAIIASALAKHPKEMEDVLKALREKHD